MSDNHNLSLQAALLGAIGSEPTAPTPSNLRFHCPYYSMHGDGGVKAASCTGEPGFKTVSRMKEHLFRVHGPPISCFRCHAPITGQDELIAHLSKEKKDICELMPSLMVHETTTFTHETRAELKRRRQKSKESPSEEEQCKEVYRILFPDQPLPNTLYVRPGGQAEVVKVLVKLLQEDAIDNPDYAILNSQVNAFLRTAREMGVVGEAVKQVHARKRLRISNDQLHTNRDGPNVDVCSGRSRPSDDFQIGSSNIGPPDVSDSEAFSFDANSWGQGDIGPNTDLLDPFENYLVD